VHVGPPHPEKPPGPVASSSNNFIRFSFTEGGQKEVSELVVVFITILLILIIIIVLSPAVKIPKAKSLF